MQVFGLSLVELCARDGRTVPRIFSDCIKWLWQDGLTVAGLWTQPVDTERIGAVIARVEKGLYSSLYDEANVDAVLVAGVLVRFLRELPEPLLSLVHEDLLRLSATAEERGGWNCDDAVQVLSAKLQQPSLSALQLLLPLLHDMGAACAPDVLHLFSPLLLSDAADDCCKVRNSMNALLFCGLHLTRC
jgi:hypothetical protein